MSEDRIPTAAHGSVFPGPRPNPAGGLIDVPAEPWVDQAVCPQTDPEEFYPEKGESTRSAKAICASCPVTAECLQYALDHDERFGVWGGLSAIERRQLRLSA